MENKTDLEKFKELYASLGITLKEFRHKKIIMLELSAHDEEYCQFKGCKVVGYPGFYSNIRFDSDGKFLSQQILE